MRPVPIHTDAITLGAFLKLAGVCRSGGEAKRRIAAGHVAVNGATEARRGRKLAPGDVVSVAGTGVFRVARASPDASGR